jgi:hypothetical protein
MSLLWRLRLSVLQKRWSTPNGMRGVISQKMKVFITTAMRTSSPNYKKGALSRSNPAMIQMFQYSMHAIQCNFFFLFLGVVWDWVHLICRPIFDLLYQPRMIDDECGAVGGMRIGRGNRSTRRKSSPVPLYPPQIPHDMTWDRTRADAVGYRRLTALRARLFIYIYIYIYIYCNIVWYLSLSLIRTCQSFRGIFFLSTSKTRVVKFLRNVGTYILVTQNTIIWIFTAVNISSLICYGVRTQAVRGQILMEWTLIPDSFPRRPTWDLY